jgi:hypothetical protein
MKYLYKMKNKLKKILTESLLKKDYRNRMIYGLSLKKESKDEWVIYDKLISELRKIGDDKHIDEIRYRVSDDEMPMKVVVDVLNKVKNKNKDLKVIEERILKQLKIEINKKNQFDLPR